MLAVSPAQPFPPGSTGCASPLLLLLPCAGSQRGDVRCSPPPTRELVWEQNSRPTKVLCRGFPSCLCLCSLSWPLKVTQVTRAMLLGSALQPELPRGARPWLWVSLPFSCLALFFRAFLLPPLGYTDGIQGERLRAAGMHAPSMPMRCCGSLQKGRWSPSWLQLPPSERFPGSGSPAELAHPWLCSLHQASGGFAAHPYRSSRAVVNVQEKRQELVSWRLCKGREDLCFPGERANCHLCLQLLQPRGATPQLALTGREPCPRFPLGRGSHGLAGTCQCVGTGAENPLQRPRTGWQVQLYRELPRNQHVAKGKRRQRRQ